MSSSLFGKPLCGNVSAPVALSFTTATITGLLCIVTVPGNLLVLLAVFIDPYKKLKSPFNILVANLATADLIVGLIVEPIAFTLHVKEGLGTLRESTVIVHLLYFMVCTASVLSIGALAVERYLAVQYEIKYRTELQLKPKRLVIVLFAIWIFSCAFSFLYLQTGYIGFSFVFNHTAVALTFAILIFTYARIFKKLRERVRRWDNVEDPIKTNQVKRQAVCHEQKATKTLLIMLAIFVVCYFPPLPFAYIMNFCISCSCNVVHVFRDLQLVFVLANSCFNPIVFAWRSDKFRKAFIKIATCRKLN